MLFLVGLISFVLLDVMCGGANSVVSSHLTLMIFFRHLLIFILNTSPSLWTKVKFPFTLLSWDENLAKIHFFFTATPLFPHLENLQESFTFKVSCLLPGDPTIYEYSKYRRLLKQQPTDKTLQHSYEVAFAKLQLAVSRRHYELKSINKDDALKDMQKNWWGNGKSTSINIP